MRLSAFIGPAKFLFCFCFVSCCDEALFSSQADLELSSSLSLSFPSSKSTGLSHHTWACKILSAIVCQVPVSICFSLTGLWAKETGGPYSSSHTRGHEVGSMLSSVHKNGEMNCDWQINRSCLCLLTSPYWVLLAHQKDVNRGAHQDDSVPWNTCL